MLPTIALAMPDGVGSPTRRGDERRVLREEVEVDRVDAALEHSHDDDHEHCRRPPAPRASRAPPCAGSPPSGGGGARSSAGWRLGVLAHVRPCCLRATRRTITCAITLAMSEKTSRITAEVDQRRLVQLGRERRCTQLAILLASVLPGSKRLKLMFVDVADHLRDGDRLADGAAEPEDQGGCDAGARVREDDAADHLPARRAKRERALLQVGRHVQEELAADAGDDRDDHDRQDQDGRELARAGRSARRRRTASSRGCVLEERAERRDDPRAPSRGCPRGRGRRSAPTRASRRARRPGRASSGGASSVRKSAIAIEIGPATSEREERRERCAEDERGRRRTGCVTGFQVVVRDEAEPELLDRRPGARRAPSTVIRTSSTTAASPARSVRT